MSMGYVERGSAADFAEYQGYMEATEKNQKKILQLQKRVEELGIKNDQLEGTAQNAFERWQEALGREEKLREALEMQPCDCYQADGFNLICERCEGLG